MPIISGTVTNDYGEALEQAHVYVQNSNPLRGVVTTGSGKYVISVLPFEKLIISYARTSKEHLTTNFNEVIDVVFNSNELPEIELSGNVKKKPFNFLALLLALSIAGNIYQANQKKPLKK